MHSCASSTLKRLKYFRGRAEEGLNWKVHKDIIMMRTCSCKQSASFKAGHLPPPFSWDTHLSVWVFYCRVIFFHKDSLYKLNCLKENTHTQKSHFKSMCKDVHEGERHSSQDGGRELNSSTFILQMSDCMTKWTVLYKALCWNWKVYIWGWTG